MTDRETFDNRILENFKIPVMSYYDYECDEERFEQDYGIEHAGDILVEAMINVVGPVPDRFYKTVDGERLYDNLHGLHNPTFDVRKGKSGYVMEVDRSGWSPMIFVYLNDDVFEIEIIPDV